MRGRRRVRVYVRARFSLEIEARACSQHEGQLVMRSRGTIAFTFLRRLSRHAALWQKVQTGRSSSLCRFSRHTKASLQIGAPSTPPPPRRYHV